MAIGKKNNQKIGLKGISRNIAQTLHLNQLFQQLGIVAYCKPFSTTSTNQFWSVLVQKRWHILEMSFPEVKHAIAAGVHLPVLHRTTDERAASSMDVSQMVFNRKICEWPWVVCCGWAASLGHHLFREYSGIYNGESAVEQKTGGLNCHYLNGSLMSATEGFLGRG